MADFTPNYNLKKPLRTEYYNVADTNGNSDIVDTQLKAVNDRVGLVEGEVDALELGKVDKVVGQSLSDENYTLIEKNKLAGIEENATADMTALEIKTEYESNADTNAYTDAERAKVANLPNDTNAQLDGKVDKVTGKGLSTNDFDNTYKQKIDVDIPAQLADIAQDVVDLDTAKAPKSDIGLLTGLLTTAKTSIVAAINELFNSKANKAQEAWISPTLINGATGTVQYRKNQLGRVEYRGYVTAASPFVDAFVLPAGYRYSETQNVLLTIGESSDLGYIRIYNAGNFRPYLANKYNLNSLSYIGN